MCASTSFLDLNASNPTEELIMGHYCHSNSMSHFIKRRTIGIVDAEDNFSRLVKISSAVNWRVPFAVNAQGSS